MQIAIDKRLFRGYAPHQDCEPDRFGQQQPFKRPSQDCNVLVSKQIREHKSNIRAVLLQT